MLIAARGETPVVVQADEAEVVEVDGKMREMHLV
jgi:hypothetical protein